MWMLARVNPRYEFENQKMSSVQTSQTQRNTVTQISFFKS
jgi:hypothetical protein